MIRKEFKNYIESIGFGEITGSYYIYKDLHDHQAVNEYQIYLFGDFYSFHNGTKWINYIDLKDLTVLKKVERSIKLKKILE